MKENKRIELSQNSYQIKADSIGKILLTESLKTQLDSNIKVLLSKEIEES